jgi:hypothetical protein
MHTRKCLKWAKGLGKIEAAAVSRKQSLNLRNDSMRCRDKPIYAALGADRNLPLIITRIRNSWDLFQGERHIVKASAQMIPGEIENLMAVGLSAADVELHFPAEHYLSICGSFQGGGQLRGMQRSGCLGSHF